MWGISDDGAELVHVVHKGTFSMDVLKALVDPAKEVSVGQGFLGEWGTLDVKHCPLVRGFDAFRWSGFFVV